MHFWTRFPFIRYSICFVLGVVLYENLQGQSIFFLLLGCGLAFVVSLLLYLKFKLAVWSAISGCLFFVLLIGIGYELTFLSIEHLQDGHYTKYEKVEAFEGRVVSAATKRTKYDRYEFEIEQVYQNDAVKACRGKIYLYVKRGDSLQQTYEYGDVLRISGSYFDVDAPDNPHEFDYRAFLSYQQIYAHAFVADDRTERINHVPPIFVRRWANDLRAYSENLIKTKIAGEKEQAVFLALLLGVKDFLDADLKAHYANAGAMHVLAVSGLHVGIFYFFLRFLFGFLKKKKWGKWLFLLLSVFFIWFYALVTGFSPSVMRAAVMFSVILLSQTVDRKSNVYNSLGIAFFVLVLFDPFLIYSVGFQLSFAAVLGIVFLQPKLASVWTPRNKLLKFFWGITCVSIAAQLATFPMTVYYFHQFPTYFLVSNLVVIPAVILILNSGILLVIISFISEQLADLIALGLSKCLWCVNALMDLLSSWPLPIVDWLYFDQVITLVVYAAIILLSLAFDYRNKNALFAGLMILLLLFCYQVFQVRENIDRQSLLFYQIKDKTAIDVVAGYDARFYADALDSSDVEVVGFQVNPFRLANGLSPFDANVSLFDQSMDFEKVRGGYVATLQQNRVLILDSIAQYDLKMPLQADFIYLNDPKFRSFELLKAKMVILGPNIKRYYRYTFEALDQAGINYWCLDKNGAFVVSL